MYHQPCKTGEIHLILWLQIRTCWSGVGANYHAAISLHDHLVVFAFLPYFVTLQLLLLSPGCMHLLSEVQWSDWHTTCWHSGSICTLPLSPGFFCQATPLALLYLICVHNLWLTVLSAQAKLLLFFTFFSTCIWHNVYSHLSSVRAMAAGVSILSDLPYSTSGARSQEISTEMEAGRRALQHTNNTGITPAFILARKWHHTEFDTNFRSNWVFFNVDSGSIRILILISALFLSMSYM